MIVRMGHSCTWDTFLLSIEMKKLAFENKYFREKVFQSQLTDHVSAKKCSIPSKPLTRDITIIYNLFVYNRLRLL